MNIASGRARLRLGGRWMFSSAALRRLVRLRRPPTASSSASKFPLLKLVLAFDTISGSFGVGAAADYSTLPCKPTRIISTSWVMFASLTICCGLLPTQHSGKVLLLLLPALVFWAALALIWINRRWETIRAWTAAFAPAPRPVWKHLAAPASLDERRWARRRSHVVTCHRNCVCRFISLWRLIIYLKKIALSKKKIYWKSTEL